MALFLLVLREKQGQRAPDGKRMLIAFDHAGSGLMAGKKDWVFRTDDWPALPKETKE